MTVDATAHGDAGDQAPGPPPPPPPVTIDPPAPPTPDGAPDVLLGAPPRAGELTPTWRLITALAWLGVAVALGAVWKTSDQLGLSTWWLGPRGEPRPPVVQLLPFVPAVVMVLAAANRIRYLSWWGAVCSALVAAIGVADLGVVPELGRVEIAIGVAALAVSVASLAGAYRPAHAQPAAAEA